MTVRYCDYTNGNDTTGSGTSGAPWKTIQKVLDNSARGDTINVANTSAQVIVAPLTWNTGYNSSGSNRLIIQAWNNGGALTIQRPDETVGRVGAHVDGNAQTQIFSDTSIPSNVILINLKFFNVTGSTIKMQSNWIMYGCWISGSTAGSSGAVTTTASDAVFVYNYISGTIDRGFYISQQRGVFLNNYLGCAPTSGNFPLRIDNSDSEVRGNIFVVTGARTAFSLENIGRVSGNTFVGDATTGATTIGLKVASFTTDVYVYNNIFYKYNGSSNIPLNWAGSNNARMYGKNAYYDCNAPTSLSATLIGIDLTAGDITGSGNPFVSSGTGNFTLATGVLAKAAAFQNAIGSLDIGAVQSAGSGASQHSSSWVG